MNMMTAYYIDTLAKDHWQQMRSDQRSPQETQPHTTRRFAVRLRAFTAALRSALRWSASPIQRPNHR